MEKTVEFTREELFDKVWTQPLSQIAKEIGISDVALGKACRRARIPLPGRGHWAKGPRHRKTATLPKLHDSYYERVTFNVRKVSVARVSPRRPGATVEIVPVPDELDSPHPLVHKTLKLSRGRASSDGLLTLDRKQALDLRVSAETLDRALRITDALIKASEARGHQWKITVEGKTVVTCDGEQLAVHMSERITRREIPRAPAAALRRRSYGEPDFSALTSTRYEWIPSNALSFHVDEYLQSVQRNWNDTRRSSLEQRLHEILGAFPGLAAEVRAERERQEERERLYRLKEERRLARVREAETLRRLRKRLATAVDRWEKAIRIRRFLAAVEATLEGLPASQAAQAKSWVEWAYEQARLLDPLDEGQLEHLCSMRVKVPEHFDGWYTYNRPKPDWWSAKSEEE